MDTPGTQDRKINARVLETVRVLRQRLAQELELEEKYWPLLDLEFSDNVLSPESTLEQAGIETVRCCCMHLRDC